ncbi:hypothetical protein TRVL_02656 [Trypanosoma vivax]|nr:hypothetical protein TRVL_02656 [Trypanosoma vivax]
MKHTAVMPSTQRGPTTSPSNFTPPLQTLNSQPAPRLDAPWNLGPLQRHPHHKPLSNTPEAACMAHWNIKRKNGKVKPPQERQRDLMGCPPGAHRTTSSVFPF